MLNFKRLTTTNWLEADETSKLFGRVSPDGTFVAMTGEDWLEFILTPRLAAIVPSEVHDLFEVARGRMATFSIRSTRLLPSNYSALSMQLSPINLINVVYRGSAPLTTVSTRWFGTA